MLGRCVCSRVLTTSNGVTVEIARVSIKVREYLDKNKKRTGKSSQGGASGRCDEFCFERVHIFRSSVKKVRKEINGLPVAKEREVDLGRSGVVREEGWGRWREGWPMEVRVTHGNAEQSCQLFSLSDNCNLCISLIASMPQRRRSLGSGLLCGAHLQAIGATQCEVDVFEHNRSRFTALTTVSYTWGSTVIFSHCYRTYDNWSTY